METEVLPTPSAISCGCDVLVIEDEPRLRTMLSEALSQMGFYATVVPSAEAAQRALAQRSFDILILDLNLPGMNGMDFLQSLRKKREEIQVIILTGFGDLEAARKAIHFDVVDFMTKPCTLGSLQAALERARKRRRAQLAGDAGEEPVVTRSFETAPEPRPLVAPENTAAAGDDELLSMEELEQRHILEVLQKHAGNRVTAAAELGISLRKIYYRIGEYQKKGLIP